LTFHANGRFWVFYNTQTNQVYRTSTDGKTWTAETIVYAGDWGAKFATWFDGTYVHYCRGQLGLYYRRGTPNADGTITWSVAEQTFIAYPGSNQVGDPVICVDSGGYPWIAYGQMDAAGKFQPWVTKSSSNDGTWTTATGFPYQLGTHDEYLASTIPLTNQKVYAFAYKSTSGGGGAITYGRLWDGNAWSSEEQISSTLLDQAFFCKINAVAIGDDVHVVFVKQATYDIIHVKRTYGIGWGSDVVVQAATDSESSPVLTKDGNNLYCFWAGAPLADHIYYKRYTEGIWDSTPYDWRDETAEDMTKDYIINADYQAYEGFISVVYSTKLAQPFNIRHKHGGFGQGTPLRLQVDRQESLVYATRTRNTITTFPK
jgi:hypothetical protein